jgi:hypothetical protein
VRDQLRVLGIGQGAFIRARNAGAGQAFAHGAGAAFAAGAQLVQALHQGRVRGVHVQAQDVHGFAGKVTDTSTPGM